jgi:predicted Zn-dependent protease
MRSLKTLKFSVEVNMKSYLQSLSEKLFNELKGDEEAALSLHSEESDFVRFNQSRVRQNTSVNQHELQLQYQAASRSYKATANLTLNPEVDFENLRMLLSDLRQQLPLIDENPKFTPMQNYGVSEIYKKCQRPQTSEVVAAIGRLFSDADLAGLYCAGPLRVASANSKGQFHYFENDQFFFDYSIYDGPRAAKGYYAGEAWDTEALASQALQLKNTLSLLKKPVIKVKPGSYRTYLAPMAVDEIAHLFNWRALSRSSYEQGFSPLKKLFLKEQLFSPQFSLTENNELGLNSHFNSLGEISPKNLPLIENGELKNFLISTATAKEYNLQSNNSEVSEGMRSYEVRAGTLDESTILSQIGTGLYLTNLHYINWSDPQAARITGMTRFACFWVENGEIAGPIQDLRFDDTLYNLFGSELLGLTSEPRTFISTSTYLKRSLGGSKVPGLLLNKMNFTL